MFPHLTNKAFDRLLTAMTFASVGFGVLCFVMSLMTLTMMF